MRPFLAQLSSGCVGAVKSTARSYGTIKHLLTIADRIAGTRTHLLASPLDLETCPQSSP